MDFIDAELVKRLGTALLVGLLIGLERGWQDRELPEGQRVAGFRTCAIVSLLGAVGALLAAPFGPLPLAALLAGLAALLVIGYWRMMATTGDLSVTTMIAVLAAFALGALAGSGEIVAAAAAAVVMTLLLGLKPELHGLLQKIERRELLATLRLLVITVAVLPVLPDEGFGPWQALNPYRIWWLVVLIAGISYVGYFAMRLAGARRGLLLTGLLGGLASSTAATLNFARAARGGGSAQAPLLAASATLACTVMFPRVAALVALLAPAVLPEVLIAFAPAVVVGLLAAGALAYMARGAKGDSGDFMPQNPLNLRMAVQFGLLLTLLSLLVRAAEEWLGGAGLLALAAVSGLADRRDHPVARHRMGSGAHRRTNDRRRRADRRRDQYAGESRARLVGRRTAHGRADRRCAQRDAGGRRRGVSAELDADQLSPAIGSSAAALAGLRLNST